MSKTKKGKDAKSIISVRALCDVCKETDIFQIPVRELLPHIGGLYQISTIHYCKDNKEMVMNIVLDRNYAVRQSSVSPFISERESEHWSSEKVNDVRFLAKQIKDADRVVQAVLSNRVVVIASKNKTFVTRIVQTLELFSPSRFPQSVDWTDQVHDNKKIIGTSPIIANGYKNAVIVNLDTKKTTNVKPARYCRTFLDSLVTLKPTGMAYAARLKIENLIEFSKMLIDLSKEPEIGPRAIDLVRMDVSADALDLILEIVDGFDPTATQILKENWI